MRKSLAVFCIIALTTLSGCQNISRRDVQTGAGGVVGGVGLGYLTGGSTAGIVAGTLGGAYVGHKLSTK